MIEPLKEALTREMKLGSVIEQHPTLGYLFASISWGVSWLNWMFVNAGSLAALIALPTAFLGLGIAWYTFRIQRRRWHRDNHPLD